MTDFLEEMDHLAAEIAKEARLAATGLDNKIAAFKALTPYWAKKVKEGEEDDDNGDDFGSFTKAIHATEHGHG